MTPPVRSLEDLQALAEQVVERCRTLARVTDVEGETTRTFLSDGMRRANGQVAEWMAEAGLRVHTDAAGNLHGVLPGARTDAAPLLLASHLDTVPNAGAFDGVLGVVAAVALAGQYRAGALPFPLHVLAFSEEEGVRFGVPFLGSRALVGELGDALLRTEDRNGVTVREAIAAYGLLPEELPRAKLPIALGYLELHLEQGPVLESEALSVGIVESVAGQSHWTVSFTGEANHAGTTPMHLRHDALAAAAAWVVEVESLARRTAGVVATVGRLEVTPGARNVVPGSVRCSLDVRSAVDAARAEAVRQLLGYATACGERRGVSVAVEQHLDQPAVAMDAALTEVLEGAVRDADVPVFRMGSGAGHDAMVVAPHLPAAMLFLRTPRGLSHHPEESVATGDVAVALRVGLGFVERLRAREGHA